MNNNDFYLIKIIIIIFFNVYMYTVNIYIEKLFKTRHRDETKNVFTVSLGNQTDCCRQNVTINILR